MNLYRGVFIGFLLLVCSTPALAADIVKLGFFDMQTVIDRSEMGKEGAEEFRLEMREVREELANDLEAIKQLDSEFKKKQHIWSEDVKKTKAQEIMGKKAEYERLTYEANRKLEDLQQELLQPIKDKVFEIVTGIGKEEGYTMIWEMRRAGLVYAPASLELTDRIIRELNEYAAKEGKDQSTEE
ncbi:MAG: OmpH family outer membrane protein [Syntrophobacteria bacterium]